MIGNDYTFSFAGGQYQTARAEVQAGMRRSSLRVELRLDGSLQARYEGGYVTLCECGQKPPVASVRSQRAVRKDHNAGGKSNWMDGFWSQPGPPLWQAIQDSNTQA